MTSHPPETCAFAFKEWAGVCAALESGRQSVILRKGGIEEGPGGFVPDHEAFWLYPTRVHQTQQGLKHPDPPDEHTPEGKVRLRALAVVRRVERVESLETLQTLDDLHVWTAETVEARFRYRAPGLWVLGVRVYRTAQPFEIEVTPEHAGCKTWVPLDPPLSTRGATLVLRDDAFRDELRRLDARLRQAP